MSRRCKREKSLKDKSFKRVLWLSPSERWRFCSAKPAPIPKERMLSLCESHGHKNEKARLWSASPRKQNNGSSAEKTGKKPSCGIRKIAPNAVKTEPFYFLQQKVLGMPTDSSPSKSHCLSASYTAMATELERFSERRLSRMGIRTQES